MIKLSHKQLKAIGKQNAGYELGNGNIYYYENDIFYLRCLEILTDDSLPVNVEQVNNVINDIKKRYPGAAHASSCQIAYSCGVYGNTGQLHLITVSDKDFNSLGSFYTYV